MKIIDFERKGNVVRFYLGEKTADWGWTNPNFKDCSGKTPKWLKPNESYYGDDWNDTPYEHNAGRVYDEFIKGYFDIKVDFDDLVLEPCDGIYDSEYCKNNMVNRKVPCIIIIPGNLLKDYPFNDFNFWVGIDGIKKYYFGDEIN